MSKFVDNLKAWTGLVSRKESSPDLARSQYSLVSCGELTPASLELWLGLPEEVKYDPSLAPFRKYYEKESTKTEKQPLNVEGSQKRLPLVSSAPHLQQSVKQYDQDDKFKTGLLNNNNDEGITIKKKDEEKEVPSSEGGEHKKTSKLAAAQYYTKMTLLLACWVFFTVIFILYNEKEVVTLQSYVGADEIKDFELNSTNPNLRILLKLSGPFVSEQQEENMAEEDYNRSEKMEVWMERIPINGSKVTENKTWTIVLKNEKELDFNVGQSRMSILTTDYSNSSASDVTYRIRMLTTTNSVVPFDMSITKEPIEESSGVIYSVILLCALYVLIIFEIINRSMAAVLVATTALAVLSIVGERPSLPEILSWLDAETLLLLFSMMVLVAIMAETGMFDFLAVFTFEMTKGKIWPLINLLCAITAVLSTFLDNVTTVLLMTPVTIRLCEVMGLDPVPVLMSMVFYSNIGGTATPVGDPPNVIIASHKDVLAYGINFANFTIHMFIGVILVCVQTYIQLRYIYRDASKLRLNVSVEVQEIRHQIAIWRRASDSIPGVSKDQLTVKERLERKIKKLSVQLEKIHKASTKRACTEETFQTTLVELKEKYRIRDKALLIKATVAVSFVVVIFFLHAIPQLNRVSLGWTALLGAILLLILADREDLEPILHRVEWSTLLFFAALFVLMEALTKLGLIAFIGRLTENLIFSVNEGARLSVALILILWVSGISSAFVDNIPLTTMMIRVVTTLGGNPKLKLPLAPLIWALSFGACLGGNGTLIGASANVVCAGVSEQHGYKISFTRFFIAGFPIMIGHLVVISGYLLVCHCLFSWH